MTKRMLIDAAHAEETRVVVVDGSRVEDFDFEGQESMLKILAVAFGGDSACTDCNRVVRMPGFQNCKYVPAHLVTVQYLSGSIYRPGDFHLDIRSAQATLPTDGNAHRNHPGKHTHSEHDWAWVSYGLAQGVDAAKLTKALESRRSDKANPLYYAQRTVDVASARLWFLEGVRIEDVVTMLEVRRRFLGCVLCGHPQTVHMPSRRVKQPRLLRRQHKP